MSAEQRKYEVVRTREGARAMLDRTTGEVMHPIEGPLPEAQRLTPAAVRAAAIRFP